MDPMYVLKETLSVNLEKIGSSLYDLEDLLSNQNYKEAELMLKRANSDLIPQTMLGSAASGISKATMGLGSPYVTASALLGAGAGLGADSLEKGVEHQNKKLSDYEKQLKMLHRQIEQLEFENAYN